MQELTGDIWSFADQGYIVIPTNGIVKANGDAVMGAGLAKEAAERFPYLPSLLGRRLKETGNQNYYFQEMNIMTFPTKNHWKEKSDINLIITSAMSLAKDIKTFRYQQRDLKFFMPQVGCGLGGLKWRDVYAKIGPILNDPMVAFVVKD